MEVPSDEEGDRDDEADRDHAQGASEVGGGVHRCGERGPVDHEREEREPTSETTMTPT